MQWPGSDSQNGSLLPVTTAAGGRAGIIGAAAVNGFADEYGSSSRDHRAEPRLRPPNYIRATSAQSRGVADEFSHLSATEAAARLRTSLTFGLSTTEALSRLRDHGPNEIPHDPPEPLWRRFLGQFREPLIVLLLASAGASVLVGNTDDAVSITIAVTIVVTVAFVQEYRSERSIEALNHLVPNHAHLVRGAGPGAMAGAGAGGGGESVNALSPASAVLSPSPPWSSVGPADLADTTMSAAAAAAAAPTDEVLEAASSKVTAAQLVPGDLVLFTAGDRIPADVRVTRAIGLTIDASNLTGENEPVRITSEPSDARGRDGATSASSGSSGNSGNIAYMGTLVRSGHGQGLVFATGGRTHFGTIATSVSGTESPRSPLQLSMDELGSQLSWFSFAVIGLISVVGWLQGKRLLDIFTISISLAVAAIPEGLPIIVTVTLALGVHRMARHNAIVRKMPKVETLGSVNVVCTDKTGTLTTNHMTTAKLWHFDAKDDAIGVDSDDEATDAKPSPAALRILRIGNLANNARLGHGSHLHGGGANGGAAARAVLSSTGAAHATRWVGQPTDVAMLDLLDRFREHDARDSVGPRLSEAPFSSERKWMGITAGGFAYMKGAVDRVLDACESCVGADGRETSLDPARRRQALEAAERMAEQGLRVLAFASGPATTGGIPPDEEAPYRGLVFAGLVGMRDPARPGVGRSIRRLMRAGVRVIMITGDAEATALAIARQLGMPVGPIRPAGSAESGSGPTAAAAVVVRGDEMDQMSDDALARAAQTAAVFARANPDHKLRIVRALQARGDIVAMTGDGVNDAPALKRADIGIAMGLGGTDVAKEAADMILADDDFSTILQAIEEGKAIFSNIQNFLTFQLSTSAAGLSLVLVCTCLGFKNPLNAMQILWINIIMDGPPAQSLGVEAVDPDVMTRPPRRRNDPVLTRPLLARIATSAAVIMTGTLMVYSREMRAGGGAGSELTRRDTTMTFTAFVLFDMYNALTCRSEAKSVLRGEVGLLSNGLFNWAVALSLAGQLMVIYVPWLQEVFQTEALSLGDLAGLAVLCSAVFWTDEMRKWWKYGRRRGLGGRYSQAV